MTSIAEGDIAVVRRRWAELMTDKENNGVLIVKTFLDRYDYYSNFARFKDHPRDTIEQNKVFRAHCTYVMNGINDIVENLHQPENVRGVLEKLGSSHGKRHIQSQQFEHLILIVLELLQLHYNTTQEEIDCWRRILKATFAIIEDNLGN